MDSFNFRKFLTEHKMTKVSSGRICEGLDYDADDYKPFQSVQIGDTVRCTTDPEKTGKVLAKGTGTEELEAEVEKHPEYADDMVYKVGTDVEDWVITGGDSEGPYVCLEYGLGFDTVAHYSDNGDTEENEDYPNDF